MSLRDRATPEMVVSESDIVRNADVGRNRSNSYSNNDCQRIMDALIALVCAEYKQNPARIKRAGRQIASVCRTRQIIIYLAHVEWSLRMAQVANCFGMERTNITHACAKIEDLRDLPSFDAKLDELATLSGVNREPDIMIVKGIKWAEMSQETRDAIASIGKSAACLLVPAK